MATHCLEVLQVCPHGSQIFGRVVFGHLAFCFPDGLRTLNTKTRARESSSTEKSVLQIAVWSTRDLPESLMTLM